MTKGIYLGNILKHAINLHFTHILDVKGTRAHRKELARKPTRKRACHLQVHDFIRIFGIEKSLFLVSTSVWAAPADIAQDLPSSARRQRLAIDVVRPVPEPRV